MKISNNAKIDVMVCGQVIGIKKSIIVDDEIWQKEYSKNFALKQMVSKNEIIVKKEKHRTRNNK